MTVKNSGGQVRELAVGLCVGVVLTLLALAFDVGAVFVLLAAVATAVTALSLLAEIRKHGRPKS
jgi:hypothetical protein